MDENEEIDSLCGPNSALADKAKQLLRSGKALGPHQAVSFARHGGPLNYEDWSESQLTGNWREKDWRNEF